MRYWLDLFSPRTWEDFRSSGSNTTGFSQNNWTRAKRIQFGDVFLCYLIGVKRWIGALRVVGDRYFDEQQELFRDGVYPVRFPVEPIVILDPEYGVPIETLRGRLSFFPAEGDYKDWSGHVRSSPTLFAEEDGAAIRLALEKAEKEPVRTPIDPKVIAMTNRKKTTPSKRQNDQTDLPSNLIQEADPPGESGYPDKATDESILNSYSLDQVAPDQPEGIDEGDDEVQTKEGVSIEKADRSLAELYR